MLIMNISIPQQIIGVRISLPAGVFITSINRAPELGVPGIGIGVALVFIWFKIQVRRQKYMYSLAPGVWNVSKRSGMKKDVYLCFTQCFRARHGRPTFETRGRVRHFFS